MFVEIKDLSEKDREFIKKAQESSNFYDRLLGKPIIGSWLPIGPKRDPETADNPELARRLMARMLEEAKKESQTQEFKNKLKRLWGN